MQRIDCLEAKVLELSNELERQCELHHDSIRRAKKAESFAMQKESCMSTLERQIASDDVMRESLRNDKSKVGIVRCVFETIISRRKEVLNEVVHP